MTIEPRPRSTRTSRRIMPVGVVAAALLVTAIALFVHGVFPFHNVALYQGEIVTTFDVPVTNDSHQPLNWTCSYSTFTGLAPGATGILRFAKGRVVDTATVDEGNGCTVAGSGQEQLCFSSQPLVEGDSYRASWLLKNEACP